MIGSRAKKNSLRLPLLSPVKWVLNDQTSWITIKPSHKNVHPMAWLRSAVSALSLWDSESQDDSPEARHNLALRLTAKMGTLVALFERCRNGKVLCCSPNQTNQGFRFGIFCIC